MVSVSTLSARSAVGTTGSTCVPKVKKLTPCCRAWWSRWGTTGVRVTSSPSVTAVTPSAIATSGGFRHARRGDCHYRQHGAQYRSPYAPYLQIPKPLHQSRYSLAVCPGDKRGSCRPFRYFLTAFFLRIFSVII